MNILMHTDVYKMGHIDQYHPNVLSIQSHLIARTDKKYDEFVFFGLRYYVEKYLKHKITNHNIQEFCEYHHRILGSYPSKDFLQRLRRLVSLPLPINIVAPLEGSILTPGNPIMTVENYIPGYHFSVGIVESLLLKLWYTCTVATYSREIKKLFIKYAEKTGSDLSFIDFQMHDFGYRSASSEESSSLAGAAHLINFQGTDTVLAPKLINDYYGGYCEVHGLSVPASEHSVMCSFGRDGELDAFKHMLNTYPSGIVSIVSDTYNLWNVLDTFADELKETILKREGKTVFRPDSGDPVRISVETIERLDHKFGHTVNRAGYRVLHPKVGMIYGDGMTHERIKETLSQLESRGYASQNLVVGVGGILHQNHSRDDLGFSFKANAAQFSSSRDWIPLFKTPALDKAKVSYAGGYIGPDELEDMHNETHFEFVSISDDHQSEYSFNDIQERAKVRS